MPRPTTFDHLKSKKKPMRMSLWVAMDPDVAKEHEEAEAEHGFNKVMLEGNPADAKLKAAFDQSQTRLELAKKALEEDAAQFIFQGMGRKKYEALVDTNQPTQDQKDQARNNGQNPASLNWNEDTFPRLLVERSLVSPELTHLEFNEIWDSDDWNNSELMAMFQAALYVNANRRVIDLGEGFGGTQDSSKSSTTASRSVSRTRSS